MRIRYRYGAIAVGLAALLAGCGGGRGGESAATPTPFAAKGQVAAAGGNVVGVYAASRFAEQVSFGPTASLVAEIRAKGFDKWIDDQFALPASQADLTPFLGFKDPVPQAEWSAYWRLWTNLAIAAPDQLRLRVTWALSQFLVVSQRKVDLVGTLYYGNMLQQYGLGRYDDLLYQVSVHPAMGIYLDNNQNRPKSAECPHCAPNENFARELMQLFSLGVFKLNPDGTPVRDAKGGFVETYSQRDVEELARVLTGWQTDPNPPNQPVRNWANWAKPMVATTWPPERDSGPKTVLGKAFPAGQTQDKDLRDAISLLMSHQNIAPFVATRLIQHLVKSNPSPAYVGRVAAKFRNNGQGVAGDMKAVVKAVLLDTEARAGDNPAAASITDGKLREPYLFQTAVWRGLGCARVPELPWGPAQVPSQMPFSAESVFSFYAPTDRAPGSNLLAPEQKLVNAQELTRRLDSVQTTRWTGGPNGSMAVLVTAGCDAAGLMNAFTDSPRAFNDWVSVRFFRGAMPPTLRSNVELLMKEPMWDPKDVEYASTRLLDFALSSPYFGVMK